MAALRDKMEMWIVSVYDRDHNTNPICDVFVKSNDRYQAVGATMDQCRVHLIHSFTRINVERANWKQEEEFCMPWQNQELP